MPCIPVGWNNLAKPVEVKVDTPEGVTVTSDLAYGPGPDVVKDKFSREFLLDIDSDKAANSHLSNGKLLCL